MTPLIEYRYTYYYEHHQVNDDLVTLTCVLCTSHLIRQTRDVQIRFYLLYFRDHRQDESL